MAETISTMPPPRGRVSPKDYPWDTWFDGKTWHLHRGTDYGCATKSLRGYAYAQATARGIKIKTVRDPDGNGLYLQAQTNTRSTGCPTPSPTPPAST